MVMNNTMPEVIDSVQPVSKKRGYVFGVLALAVLLVLSLVFNAFLGWRVLRLRDSIATLEANAQLKVGATVPPIKARSLDGREALISFNGEERPTLLYFFSPGCDTCERNIPNIKSLAEQKSGDYKIIGLALSDEELGEYVKEKGINFPVYSGLGVDSTINYKLGRVPQTTVVSSEGRVLANWHGPFDGKQRPAIESYFDLAFSR